VYKAAANAADGDTLMECQWADHSDYVWDSCRKGQMSPLSGPRVSLTAISRIIFASRSVHTVNKIIKCIHKQRKSDEVPGVPCAMQLYLRIQYAI
jgi:hypothetical protein